MYHEAAKIVKPKMDYLTVQTARYSRANRASKEYSAFIRLGFYL